MSDHGHDPGSHESLLSVTHDQTLFGSDMAGFSIGAAIHSAVDTAFGATAYEHFLHHPAPHDPQADAAALAEILLWQLNSLSLEGVTTRDPPQGGSLQRSETSLRKVRRFRPSEEDIQMSLEARPPSSFEGDAEDWQPKE